LAIPYSVNDDVDDEVTALALLGGIG